MKVVCVDARMIDSAGIGAYLANLLRFFKDIPFQMKAVIHSEHQERIEAFGKIETILLTAPIYSISEQISLPLKIPKCDLFWSPHYNVPLLPIKAKKRLTTIHDAYHLAFFKTLSPLQKIYAKLVMNAAVLLSEKVITDSEFSKSEIKKYTLVDERKLDVIPLAVDQNIFQPRKELGDEDYLKKYRLPKRFILFVGNLKPHKNLRGLLRAFHLLVEEGATDVGLVVVGKGEGFKTGEDSQALLDLFPNIKKQTYFLGRVTKEDLIVLYRSAQAFVLPSFYEGFGLPPLEAMSSGCPVIVSNCPSLSEVCADAAVYINPFSAEEILQAIKRVLKDDSFRQELIRRGLEQSRSFSWKKCAEKHIELMNNLLNT